MTTPPIAQTLSPCDLEPIHLPGAIQPHGILLVVDRESLQVRHVAGAVERDLGVDAWQGLPLRSVIGDRLAGKVATLLESVAAGGFIGQIPAVGGDVLDVSLHLAGPWLMVELEAAPADIAPNSVVLERLETAVAGFERTLSLTALCGRAAIEFRRLTGFDRVMVYCFLEGDVGQVLAEDRREGMRSFLNHHFPASDIPRQARGLYLRNLVRTIPDATYQPAPLRPPWGAAQPLDMSDSVLRSVSPVHLEYLANMGVRASASVSIVKDGLLWGLIACHSETPMSLSHDVRAACKSLAASLARQITAKETAEGFRQRVRLRSFKDEVVQVLSREGQLAETLPAQLGDMIEMMQADGVAMLRGRDLVLSGVCPPDIDVRALAAWLLDRGTEPVFATDCLVDAYFPAQGFAQTGSGVLAVTVSPDEPWLLIWFRAEQIETINWAGNPHKPDAHLPMQLLSPRASFDAWKESVRGRSRAWSLPEIDSAARLRLALLEVRQSQRMRELNRQLTRMVQDKDRLIQQKEFLIGEINHRVQNSLQIVSSFLMLQGQASEDPALQAALKEARRRLSAVGLVHRRLYRADQIEVVDAGRYLEELCADTVAFMGDDWASHLTLDLAPVMVSADQAAPLGLVLTELMINCNKYAYGGKAGPVDVQLTAIRGGLRMIVADKGVGRPALAKGFGSRIIAGLVSQLGGEIVYGVNDPGLRATVTIAIQPTRPKLL